MSHLVNETFIEDQLDLLIGRLKMIRRQISTLDDLNGFGIDREYVMNIDKSIELLFDRIGEEDVD